VNGESFVIARDGKPLVKVEALHAAANARRIGFLDGEVVVPDDFDRMGEKEIAAMFGADV
jgi:antitoxin (DNA-binding transcriptional repressor) of toxin-antitoxin stability system